MKVELLKEQVAELISMLIYHCEDSESFDEQRNYHAIIYALEKAEE